MSWRTPLAASVLSLVVVGQLRVLRPELTAGSYMMRLQISALVLAATASIALDDPAAPLLVSSPTVLRTRSGARITLAVMCWAVAWAPTIVVVSLTPDHLDLTELGLQATVLLAIALGVSAVAGQVAGAVAVAVVGLVALALPATWSVLDDDRGAHLRLGVLIAGALVALVRGTRDRATQRLWAKRSSSLPARTMAP
ncbi:MAG: hypothetical protein ABI658_07805 [Acidimicrobiales bacterium]